MASYFLSDIHLKPFRDPKTHALSRYLESLDSETQNVFLLGDIFDFWMGGHQIWQDRYRPIVESIRKLRSRAVNVYFFEGNHDIHVDPFWQKELGVTVLTEPQILNLHGLKVRIEHGDLFNPQDKNYILLRNFLRSVPLRVAALHAPGKLVAAIADWGSATSHKYSSKKAREDHVVEDIRRRMREYVKVCAQKSDFDLLIMGHTHIRENYSLEVNKKTIQFINLGSWFESQPKAFVLDQNSQRFEDIPL